MRLAVLKLCGLLVVVLMLISGNALAISNPSAAKITTIKGWYQDISEQRTTGSLLDFGMSVQSGLVVEIQIEASEEIRVWPQDFAIAYEVEGEEYRITGSSITNAVSDPEDERSWRTSSITVRKGTRYFMVLFPEFSLSFDQSQTLMKGDFDTFTLLYRVMLPGEVAVEWPVIGFDEWEDDYPDADEPGMEDIFKGWY